MHALPAAGCRDCRYFMITWDVQFPYGCRAHTFKSKKSPAEEVFEASGMQCLLFAPRAARRPVLDTETNCL